MAWHPPHPNRLEIQTRKQRLEVLRESQDFSFYFTCALFLRHFLPWIHPALLCIVQNNLKRHKDVTRRVDRSQCEVMATLEVAYPRFKIKKKHYCTTVKAFCHII